MRRRKAKKKTWAQAQALNRAMHVLARIRSESPPRRKSVAGDN
jgi:hypothetical protein